MACAVNDSLLPSNYINLATPAEPLFYTVAKAKHILNATKNDTIIIAFSHNSLTSAEWILNDEVAFQRYTSHFATLSLPQHAFLWKENPAKSVKTIMLLTPLQIYNSMKKLYGGYEPLHKKGIRPLTPEEKKRIDPKSKYNLDKHLLGYQMLDELITEYPKTYFIVTRPPTHKMYVPEKDDSRFQTFVSKLLKHKNCHFIDFRELPLKDSMFADEQHLNYEGACYFTSILLDSIQSNRHVNTVQTINKK
jgi:hypothetical protein